MKADISQDQCLDAAHTFVTGFSMGGYFSEHVGCERSDIRAVAPHSGGTLASLSSCTTGHVPVILFHGTADEVIADGCDDPNGLAQSGFPPAATLWAAEERLPDDVHHRPDGRRRGRRRAVLRLRRLPRRRSGRALHLHEHAALLGGRRPQPRGVFVPDVCLGHAARVGVLQAVRVVGGRAVRRARLPGGSTELVWGGPLTAELRHDDLCRWEVSEWPAEEQFVAAWFAAALTAVPAFADTVIYSDARVSVDIPPGWSATKSGATLTVQAPKGDVAASFVAVADGAVKKAGEAAGRELAKVIDQIAVKNTEAVTVNGMKGSVVSGDGRLKGTDIDWMVMVLDTPSPVNNLMIVAIGEDAKLAARKPEVNYLFNHLRPAP